MPPPASVAEPHPASPVSVPATAPGALTSLAVTSAPELDTCDTDSRDTGKKSEALPSPLALMKRGASLSTVAVLLAPAWGGWRLVRKGAGAAAAKAQAQVVYPTLAEAWEAAVVGMGMGAGAVLLPEVALPTHVAILERLLLPSSERAELDGMVPLQLEKILPYSVEETVHGYEVLADREVDAQQAQSEEGIGDAPKVTESAVVATAVHLPTVEALLAPLLEAGVYPARLSLWGADLGAEVAATLKGGAICGIWGEGAEAVFAIFEDGVLVFLEALFSVDALVKALPRLLMSAELAGAGTQFAALYLDPIFEEQGAALAAGLGLAAGEAGVKRFTFQADGERSAGDLTPQAWKDVLAQRLRKQQLLQRLLIGVGVYVALLLLAFGVVSWRKYRLRKLESLLATVRPELDVLLAHQARWKAMGPAVDTRKYTLELLREVFESLPSSDVRVTLLEQEVGQFKVDVEAPSPAAAIDFGERLKAREALADYTFEAGQPTILGPEKTHFRIFGKL